MVKAQIENGIVVNVIAVDPDNTPAWCADWPAITGSTGIGWAWDGKNFIPPVEPEVVI